MIEMIKGKETHSINTFCFGSGGRCVLDFDTCSFDGIGEVAVDDEGIDRGALGMRWALIACRDAVDSCRRGGYGCCDRSTHGGLSIALCTSSPGPGSCLTMGSLGCC